MSHVTHPAPTSTLRRARARWVGIIVAAVVLFALVYVLAVLTDTGQRWENAALAGSADVPLDELAVADDTLNVITRVSLAVATALIGVIGLIRGGLRLAAAGAGIIAVGLGVAEVLKRFVRPRPDLIGADQPIAHSSFPSGHTTIAMTVMVAVLVVVPWRWRGVAMALVMTWSVSVGAYTVTAAWHRLSDTVGSDLLTLVVGSCTALLLARSGMVHEVTGRARVLRVVFVVLMGIGALGAHASGILLVTTDVFVGTNDSPDYRVLMEAQAFASAASIAAGLVAWWSWRRLEVVPAPRS